MERTATCHCGALKAITAGGPERVYPGHYKLCQLGLPRVSVHHRQGRPPVTG